MLQKMAAMAMLVAYIACWIISNARESECLMNSARISEIMASYSSSYRIRMIPRKKGEHINVSLGFHIMNMVPLSFTNDHIFVEFDLMEKWVDKRLSFENTSANDILVLQNKDTETIWKPDIFILYETGEKHETFPANQSAAYIFPDGTVNYFARLSVTVYCPMSMRMFPFDRQRCPLRFESYSYNIKQVRLSFLEAQNNLNATLSDHFKISRFLLHDLDISHSSLDYGLSGVYDQISLVFLLRRDIRYYIMEYYFPVICVVFLSFMSFWIHYKATPARVALPVTTFLTLTTMLEHVRSSASIIGTADALEIFLSGSNIFVFANIIEYALVGITERYWTKKSMRRRLNKSKAKYRGKQINSDNEESQESENNIEESIDNEENPNEARQDVVRRKSSVLTTFADGMAGWIGKKNEECHGEMHYLDKICRYLFPLCYTTFLIIYSVVCAVHLLK